jgi:protein-S-isoprenylcysteine O-methyltransferase Ste14
MFRWFALAAFVGCLGISATYRLRARQQGETIARRRESPMLITGRAVVALPLFVAILLYLLNPRWMAWAEFALPAWARWVGALLGLVAVPAAWWVFTSIGRNVSETVLTKRDHALVTTGPYRWIRHPLYTTGAVLLLAIGLMAANWFVLLFALVAIVALRLAVIPVEERELVNKFGDEYRRYMARTGRLLPQLSRKPRPS